MMLLSIDELNIRPRAVEYETYFGEMELTAEQYSRRMEFSKGFEDIMLFVLSLILLLREFGEIDYGFVRSQLESRYREIMGDNLDETYQVYISEFADEIIRNTQEHTKDNIEGENGWYLSDDRAKFVAENEANTSQNYLEYKEAVESGKTKKKWVDMADVKVRPTHKKVGGKVIPIDEYFVVGEALMRFPKDLMAIDYPEEIVNCRCTIKYF